MNISDINPNSQKLLSKNKIRSQFLSALSKMYSEELPEYKQFVDIVNDSNQEFIKNNPDLYIDSPKRVMEERHGAIRVGKSSEIRTISRIFSCMGMEPVNFYDLTKVKNPMPVISTAFRPKTKEEIDQSAFRMFVSMLFIDDKRFFNDHQKQVIEEKLAKRELFDDELLEILDINEKNGGLDENQAKILIKKTADALKMDKNQTIDFNLYKNFIINGNDVAADIICFNSIHINHLTPRVYDIFDAHKRLQDANIPTIDNVQGPPKRHDESVLPLLNQTSRKAPGEYVYTSISEKFLSQNESDQLKIINKLKSEDKIIYLDIKSGENIKNYLDRASNILLDRKIEVVAIKHKARFGEIECRGVSLTPKGREIYDQMIQNSTYIDNYPKTHKELVKKAYAYYEYYLTEKYYSLNNDEKNSLIKNISTNNINEKNIDKDIFEMIDGGFIGILPITYEDFLPKSAAGIFESNLSGETKIMNKKTSGKSDNQVIIEKAMNKKIINSYELYLEIENKSKDKILKLLKACLEQK
jgi:uncharacterized glyoxalase superfamily metalloenzyme YdcJ